MILSTISIRRADENRNVVRRPVPGDAVGQSLRGVFGGDTGLPEDMLRALREIDRTTPRH